MNAEEWRILSLVDGTRSVNAIIKESGYGDFIVYKVLYSLVSSGLIDMPKTSAARKRNAPKEKPKTNSKRRFRIIPRSSWSISTSFM